MHKFPRQKSTAHETVVLLKPFLARDPEEARAGPKRWSEKAKGLRAYFPFVGIETSFLLKRIFAVWFATSNYCFETCV